MLFVQSKRAFPARRPFGPMTLQGIMSVSSTLVISAMLLTSRTGALQLASFENRMEVNTGIASVQEADLLDCRQRVIEENDVRSAVDSAS